MKQYEAVIETIEKLGGQATLGQLYIEVMKVKDCDWKTKTPFASIRRIVQVRPEIFKVRPGLYALRSYQKKLNLVTENEQLEETKEVIEQNHSYYQGLLASIGNFRHMDTFIPNQDKNKKFLNQSLASVRSLDAIPQFSYDRLVARSSTVDVIWFNERKMPHSLFEVEHSTDIQGALLKFVDLQDFFCRMVIVADQHRKKEYSNKLAFQAFKDIKSRVEFLNYEALIKQYETEVFKSNQEFNL
jgi:hypothetical protein